MLSPSPSWSLSVLPSTESPISAQAPAMTGLKSRYLLISLAILLADQWSKWLVEAHLRDQGSMTVIPGLLNFINVRNTGVAFGLFPAHGDFRGTLLLVGLGLLALGLVAYYFFTTAIEERLLLIALAAIMGGAVGNLVDRLVRGAVTDFIDFHVRGYHWHTFNIADSAISIGICLMLLGSFRPANKQTSR
jgi:signal peptidase II